MFTGGFTVDRRVTEAHLHCTRNPPGSGGQFIKLIKKTKFNSLYSFLIGDHFLMTWSLVVQLDPPFTRR